MPQAKRKKATKKPREEQQAKDDQAQTVNEYRVGEIGTVMEVNHAEDRSPQQVVQAAFGDEPGLFVVWDRKNSQVTFVEQARQVSSTTSQREEL